ncbi:MAG: 3-5 exonuclease [Thermoleophilia bacterium]|nr:3-5 exonuclease [Thermoleophilia bacterium]
MRWAAVDFETATSSRSSACALGVVVVEDGIELHRQAWLIRPPRNAYDVGNIAIHGIRPMDTEEAPEFGDVWGEAMELIGDRPLVAHNAGFDVGVIRRSCEEFRLQPPSARYLCTVQLSRRTWPDLTAHKLPIVAGHVGAQLNHHDALSDAAACSTIFGACIETAGVDSVDALIEHHALRDKRVDVR